MKIQHFIVWISLTFFYACGPLTAHSSIAKAEIAIEAARGVEANRYAIFEYKSAKNYLLKAKEEEGYSSFQNAINLAKKALEFANEARARAFSIKQEQRTNSLKNGNTNSKQGTKKPYMPPSRVRR